MKKQTAVQYIIDNYSLGKTLGEMKIILATAKEMEKQQIIKSNRDGVDMVVNNDKFITGEQYYNEKYGE